jgi:hypothetical protein
MDAQHPKTMNEQLDIVEAPAAPTTERMDGALVKLFAPARPSVFCCGDFFSLFAFLLFAFLYRRISELPVRPKCSNPYVPHSAANDAYI